MTPREAPSRPYTCWGVGAEPGIACFLKRERDLVSEFRLELLSFLPFFLLSRMSLAVLSGSGSVRGSAVYT